MPKRSLFPYCKLRERADKSIRPRFEPGPRERALGFAAQDLRNEDGSWFSLDAVRRFATSKAAEIEARRKGAPAPADPPSAASRTVAALLDAFERSPDYARLKPRTRRDYRIKSEAIRFRPRTAAERQAKVPRRLETFALAPARIVGAPEVKAFFEHLAAERGLAMARGSIAVLSAAFKWARLAADWRLGTNPCHDLDLPKLPTRVIVFTPDEVSALMRMADAIGEHAVGDAVVIGLLTDQRPTDILEFDAAAVDRHEGVVRLVQSKTGSRVEVPALPWLTARLELMAERRLRDGWTCQRLVVNPATGEGYTERAFNGAWRRAIAATAAGREFPAGANGQQPYALPACPSIEGKMFKHLRKTTFTWLHRSGSDLASIASVSGHSVNTVAQMAAHYLELGRDPAVAALLRLETWMQAKGVQL